jgi:medium-chain acyl-[acyl-carrier-protein] hydrolase
VQDLSTSGKWVTCHKALPPGRIRLFCIACAGGGASMFRSWDGNLAPHIELVPVQLPGREARMREPPFTNMRRLIASLAVAVEPFTTSPFAIFGHSMGGLISFELARHLRQAGKQMPSHLFIAACRAPQLPSPGPIAHSLPEQELLAFLRSLDGTPEELLRDSEAMQIFLPLIRADFQLCETYKYHQDAPLDCPISALAGIRDLRVLEREMHPWGIHARKQFNFHSFAGGHFFTLESSAAVLEYISQTLSTGSA